MTGFPEITITELINNGFDYVKNLESFYLITKNLEFDELIHYAPFILNKGFKLKETFTIVGAEQITKSLFIKEVYENEVVSCEALKINTLVDIHNIIEIENHINQMELCAPRLHNRFNHLRELLNLNLKS